MQVERPDHLASTAADCAVSPEFQPLHRWINLQQGRRPLKGLKLSKRGLRVLGDNLSSASAAGWPSPLPCSPSHTAYTSTSRSIAHMCLLAFPVFLALFLNSFSKV